MLHIYIDGDACPVKNETYKVAERFGLSVTLVSNSWMQIPNRDWLTLEVVEGQFDAADDWIVEHVEENDVVITADIPLAARCIEKKAAVLGPRGRPFTEDEIGDALASRELMSHLRDAGLAGGGPAPFEKKDRSRFLQELDTIINRLQRSR